MGKIVGGISAIVGLIVAFAALRKYMEGEYPDGDNEWSSTPSGWRIMVFIWLIIGALIAIGSFVAWAFSQSS